MRYAQREAWEYGGRRTTTTIAGTAAVTIIITTIYHNHYDHLSSRPNYPPASPAIASAAAAAVVATGAVVAAAAAIRQTVAEFTSVGLKIIDNKCISKMNRIIMQVTITSCVAGPRGGVWRGMGLASPEEK